MNKFLVIAVGLCIAAGASAQTIAQWNFNSTTPDANTGTGTTAPNIGMGSLANVGGITNSYASGDASGGSSDPASGDDSAYNTTTYAAQGAGSGTRGVEFAISSLGFKNLMFSFDVRFSNTSSRNLQVSAWDGSSWTTVGSIQNTLGGDKWMNGNMFNLSSLTSLNHNPNLKLRVTSIFEPNTSEYKASNPTSTYGTSGTLRYDMVTLKGEVVPEPASMAALGLGALAIMRRRRAAK